MTNRYQQAYDAVVRLKQSRKERGHFLHIINNLSVAIMDAADLQSRGELDIESKRDAEKSLLALIAYAELMKEHPAFRDAELRNGYFMSPERQPEDLLQRKEIVSASNYVKYAVSRLK